MTEKTIRIDLPTDSDGFLPRQCPHCEQRFSIHGDSYEQGRYLNLRCPYCGMIEEFDEFLTEEQAEYSQATAQNEAREMAAKELEDALGDVFDGVSSGSIDFGEIDTPSPHLSHDTVRTICPNCEFRYGVIEDSDEDSLCPVCR